MWLTQTIKAVISSLLDQGYPAPVSLPLLRRQFFLGVKLPAAALSSSGKMSWEGGERRKCFARSVIQRHSVNASILFVITSVNCRSDSPTHSTLLLSCLEKETLRPGCDIQVRWGAQWETSQSPSHQSPPLNFSLFYHRNTQIWSSS